MTKRRTRKKKKKLKFSKLIVLIVILLNVLFTGGILYVFVKTGGMEPSTLVASFFGFTTVELWSLSKIKRDESKNDSEDGRGD